MTKVQNTILSNFILQIYAQSPVLGYIIDWVWVLQLPCLRCKGKKVVKVNKIGNFLWLMSVCDPLEYTVNPAGQFL
jgi:hypothetical protein